MQYHAESKWAGILVLVLLGAMVQQVSCPADGTGPYFHHSHLDHRAPAPSPAVMNPCGNHSVPCNPAGNHGARVVTILSSFISAALLLLPMFRVKGLQPRRSEADTLFWWSIFLGFVGYGLWTIYFMHCFHPHASVFFILLACIFGLVVYFTLLCVATSKTTKLGDVRPRFAVVVALGAFIPALCFKLKDRHYAGWFGLGFTILSHLCRMASTAYLGAFDRLMFGASVVGSINGFLWLIHPQLCLSTEYKVNSYIIGVLRGVEAFYWCSLALARMLWSLEGEVINAPAPCGGAPPGAAAAPVVVGAPDAPPAPVDPPGADAAPVVVGAPDAPPAAVVVLLPATNAAAALAFEIEEV